MPPTSDKLPQRYFVIDSCILEYLLRKEMIDPILQQLDMWRGNYLEIGISEITYAELLDGAYRDKELKVIELIEKLYSFSISKSVLKTAGKLGSIYKQEFGAEKGISIGDKIIAATSIIHGAPIVTANIKDFPQPFFRVIKNKNIIYRKDSSDRMIYIAVLYPNYDYINYSFKARH